MDENTWKNFAVGGNRTCIPKLYGPCFVSHISQFFRRPPPWNFCKFQALCIGESSEFFQVPEPTYKTILEFFQVADHIACYFQHICSYFQHNSRKARHFSNSDGFNMGGKPWIFFKSYGVYIQEEVGIFPSPTEIFSNMTSSGGKGGLANLWIGVWSRVRERRDHTKKKLSFFDYFRAGNVTSFLALFTQKTSLSHRIVL